MRQRLGYSVSNGNDVVNGVSSSISQSLDGSDGDAGRKLSSEGRLPDGDSLRCALQRVSFRASFESFTTL